MNLDLIYALEQLEKEKGIQKDVILEAIEAALVLAYKKNFVSNQNIKVRVDRDTGEVHAFSLRKVVSEVLDESGEVSLEEARKDNPTIEEGDIFETEVTSKKFGRIAAQTAKQVVLQRLREAQRDMIFDDFSGKVGEIVTGIVQRSERGNVIIDLGKTEAILPYKEQVPREKYAFNDRIKVYVKDVKKTTKGPLIYVSRADAGLVQKLFELEVPEIASGLVEVRGISREAGSRTKIAVYCKDDDVDPIGACVGPRGTRVQNIVDELRNEKIDIIKWSSDVEEYITSSLSPAKPIRVTINEEEKSASVVVPDSQLSLAIGREGQNVRLAVKLTGWKIDIKNSSDLRQTIEKQLLNFDASALFKDDTENDE